MRVGKKANVKHQVGVIGHAVFESKAHTRDQDAAIVSRAVLKAVDKVGSKFMHVELRSVDDQVSQRSDASQMASLSRQGCPDGGIRAQRMRPPRLAESAYQRGVAGLEKDDPRRDHPFYRFQDVRQFLKLRALPDIDYEGSAG